MKSILIVDDSQDIIVSLKSLLNKEGLTVDSAESTDEANAKLASNSYDIVVLDLMFPGDTMEDLSGLKFISTIKDFYPDVGVIILTGNSTECTIIEALNRGADAFIVKPFKMDELKNMLSEVMNKQYESGVKHALYSAYCRIGRAMQISKDAFNEASEVACKAIDDGNANGVILDAFIKGNHA